MKAHFIDLDILLKVDQKPWIVDKSNPNVPIIKIDPHEFNLFKSGVYKNQGNKIQFNGKQFWLPSEFMNKLKVKTKNQKVDISNLAISMQEFMNPEIVQNMEPKIDTWIFNSLINQQVHIYIFCSKNTKKNMGRWIEKIEDKMREMGLKVEGWYYLTENFTNKNSGEIAYNKIKTVLQHMVGVKTDGDKFSDQEIQNYDDCILWDDSSEVVALGKDINRVLENLLIKTDDSIKAKIKGEIKDGENHLIIKEWTYNLTNRYNQFEIELVYSNLIRSFENFRRF